MLLRPSCWLSSSWFWSIIHVIFMHLVSLVSWDCGDELHDLRITETLRPIDAYSRDATHSGFPTPSEVLIDLERKLLYGACSHQKLIS